ncbi:MAG: AI-2E family transporter [Actinomycetota bacterium]|nr:AI-2E family transporter [Actinomycetota bacterium]
MSDEEQPADTAGAAGAAAEEHAPAASEHGTPPQRTRGRPLTAHSPFSIGFFGALGVLVALALKSVLASASSVILLVVVSLFLAVGLDPAVQFMTRQGVRRGIAVVVVFAALLVTLTLFVVALVPVISDQVSAIVAATPDLVRELKSNSLINSLNQRFDILDQISRQVQSGGIGSQLAGGVLGIGLAVLGALANTLIVVILTLYFLASLPRIKRSAYRLVPASRRERVSGLGEAILRGVGRYVSGAFVVALTAGISSLIFLFVVGLGEYAVALAFVVLVCDLVPLIGATIAAVIVSAIGLAQDPTIGLACIIFYVVYQQLENYVVYPRVMANAADVPGAVTVVAVLAGATLLGVIGALLAIPTAAALLLLTREVLIRRQDTR